jgi:hypothetical protein
VRDELETLIGVVEQVLEPSGDTTGATDIVNIQAALDATGHCQLSVGTYYVNTPVLLNAARSTLRGVGRKTILYGADADESVVKIGGTAALEASYIELSDMRIERGNDCVEITNSVNIEMRNLDIQYGGRHGVYMHDEVYIISIRGCTITSCTDDGINAVSTGAEVSTGNALNIIGGNIENNDGYGVLWSASGLSVVGCCIEGNGKPGVKVTSANKRAQGFAILGSYFESNGEAEIELEQSDANLLIGGCIDGNFITTPADQPAVKCTTTGTVGLAKTRDVRFGAGNYFGGSTTTERFAIGSNCYRCVFEDLSESNHDMPTTIKSYNRTSYIEARPVVTEAFTVLCNATGTAKTAALITLPAGSTIHQITAQVTQVMNGDATTTFEVGVATNTDKYIDPVDLTTTGLNAVAYMIGGTNNDQKTEELVVAETAIVATWTNDASATTGVVVVRITYSENSYTNGVAVPT